ncbi:hypothetical protein BKA63DRAFT_156283 [Paraphoma chrysanthemicola]|nr:hypothetical protein BKA63DRAFT_156283 [Paraphoma chrysanthemicola]
MATSMKNTASTQLSTIPRVLPAINRVWTNTVSESRREKEPGRSAANEGTFIKGMDRLVNVLERRIDRQILAAQIRAYDDPSVTPAKSHHL